MVSTTTARHAGPRGWLVAEAAGWLALAGSYYLVRPVFGVLSATTWVVVGACWVWVIGVPLVGLVRLAVRRLWTGAAALLALAVVAGGALWMTGWPQRTPEASFQQHREAMVDLAARYRAGKLGESAELPWRLRLLSLDGQAHRRCSSSDRQTGARECALYLPAWQDWRAENGNGFAYYPTPPGTGATIVTADGDTGTPVRELGDGWWWVE